MSIRDIVASVLLPGNPPQSEAEWCMFEAAQPQAFMLVRAGMAVQEAEIARGELELMRIRTFLDCARKERDMLRDAVRGVANGLASRINDLAPSVSEVTLLRMIRVALKGTRKKPAKSPK